MRRKPRPVLPVSLSFSFWRQARQSGLQRQRRTLLCLEHLENRITPTGPTLSTLANFNGTNGVDGYDLIRDSNGNLYGLTTNEGTSSTIFELANGSSTIITRATFAGTSESYPFSLMCDSSGNLFGLTGGGSAITPSTIFELPKGSSTIATLAYFNSTENADPSLFEDPNALVMDSNGNLYGTTYYGGTSDEGTVFELPNGSGTPITLADFSYPTGEYPNNLIRDSSGNLYGTTVGQGFDESTDLDFTGTIFEIPNGGTTVKTLAEFTGPNDGSSPTQASISQSLILDNHGDLYGTTQVDGGELSLSPLGPF